MRIRVPRSTVAILLVASVGCYRYVVTQEPPSAAGCPPTPRAFFRQKTDSSTRGVIHGRAFIASLSDSAPAPLAGATVAIQELRRGVLADSDGAFRLGALPPGRYVVTVRQIGYHTSRDTVLVGARAGSAIEVGLRPAPMDECPGFAVVIGRKRVWRWPWQ